MSGAQTSTFANQNDLLANNQQQAVTYAQNLANQYAPERNRLFVQAAQQEAGQKEMGVIGQAGQAMLNLSDEASRAAAWPGMLQNLQANGFAKNAPTTYPGEQAMKLAVARSLPVPDQFGLGMATSPAQLKALQDIYRQANGGGGTGTGTTTAPAVPGGAYGQGGGNNAPVPPEYLAHFQEASARTGIPVDVLVAQARQESGFNANAVGGAGEIGIGQMPARALPRKSWRRHGGGPIRRP